MIEIRRSVQLAIIFFIGLVAGIWTVIAPWVLGYPGNANGSWTSSVWSAIWVGGVVTVASAGALVVIVAFALNDARTLGRRPTPPAGM